MSGIPPTPEAAHARIDAHERVCAERYGNINDKLVAMQAQMNAQGTQFHERFNTISARMWAAACGLILLSVGGLATLLMMVITRVR